MIDGYMGIDQSYGGFGIAVWMPELDKAEFDLATYPPKKLGAGVDRLKAVSEHVVDVVHELNARDIDIRHICMEGYARNAKFRREEAGELGATVKLTLTAAFSRPVCYPTIVAPTLLKSFVTSKGNASKQEMIKGVYKKYGQLCFNDNLADAYGLARLAERLHTGDPVTSEITAILAKLTLHTERPAKAA